MITPSSCLWHKCIQLCLTSTLNCDNSQAKTSTGTLKHLSFTVRRFLQLCSSSGGGGAYSDTQTGVLYLLCPLTVMISNWLGNGSNWIEPVINNKHRTQGQCKRL
jgi:hypothetical protein